MNINDTEILEKINELKNTKALIKQQINKIKANSILSTTPFKNYVSILRTLITNTVVENDYRQYPNNILGKLQFFETSANNIKYLLQQVGITGQMSTPADCIPYISAAYQIYEQSLPKQYIYGYQGSQKCILNTKTNQIEYVQYFQQDPCRTFKYCVIDDCATRHINYYLDMTDITKKADGTDACLTGQDGDVFVQLPPFHFRCQTLSDGTKRKLMSTEAFEGSTPHPFTLVSPDGNTARTQYVGYYIATLSDVLTDDTHECQEFPWYDEQAYPNGYSKLRSINGGQPGSSHTRPWLRQSARHNGANLINTMFYAYLYDIALAQSEFPCAYLSPLQQWITASQFFQGLTGYGSQPSDPVYLMQDGIQINRVTPYKYTLSTDAYSDKLSDAKASSWLTHNIVMIGGAYGAAYGGHLATETGNSSSAYMVKNDYDLIIANNLTTLNTGYKYKINDYGSEVSGYLGKQTYEDIMTSQFGATDFPHIVIRGKSSEINYALHYIQSMGYLHTRIQC